jgi:hypothetical protein
VQFNFNVECVSIEMTGNKSDYYGNSKLMSFGCEKQGFSIVKQNKAIKVNMFGLTLGSYNRFEELYKFLMRTKNTMLKVKETMTSQIKDEDYVQSLKKAIDTAKNIAPASRSDRSYSEIGAGDNNDFQ